MRWTPKDNSAYKQWVERQELIDAAAVASQQSQIARQIEIKRLALDGLNRRLRTRMAPFASARQKYFNHLYQKDKDAWWVLDPVITVHPDEVFFECFSRDESSYGRLSVDFDVFKNVGEFACGTTNIDYSETLYDAFQKMRGYKTTQFEIDPSGFDVQTTGEAAYKEVKIDLPDSWVRGFLQVSSAMSLPAVRCDLHPMDVHNICFILRRRREVQGPRSMRYRLTPGGPASIVFDPWGIELKCPRSICHCEEEMEIRIWGRRRIHILERLIPQAKRFTVHLLGYGMPSFYVADLGPMTFTLGLSGWTANDWSDAGNFDLLAPRVDVDTHTKQRVFAALKENWLETPDALAKRLDLARPVVLGALGAYTQAGRAIWDLNKSVYRARELSRDPLPIDALRFTSDRERIAWELVRGGHSRVLQREAAGLAVKVVGSVQEKKKFEVILMLDADERVIDAQCECNFHQQNKLRMGPCSHILALRKQNERERQPTLSSG